MLNTRLMYLRSEIEFIQYTVDAFNSVTLSGMCRANKQMKSQTDKNPIRRLIQTDKVIQQKQSKHTRT